MLQNYNNQINPSDFFWLSLGLALCLIFQKAGLLKMHHLLPLFDTGKQ